MPLFQNSVLRNHIKTIDRTEALKAFETYKNDFLPKIDNIRTSKEEQYQYGFLDDLFVKVLGYTLNPTPNYNLIAEQKNQTDSKKADGAILKDEQVIAVIELKSTKTKSMESIVNQAFNYKHNHPSCKYVITSNFEKLRFYIEHSNDYEEFDLFTMDEDRFVLLYTLLHKESIFDDTPLTLKSQSKLKEENISNELYKKYAALRTSLFDNIVKNNPSIDKYILLEKTQTILDRMVFIFFGEDRGILPLNTIRAIIDHYKNDIEDRELWHFYKIYFKAINEGNPKLGIPEYNGGLFTTDELLDSLIIDADIIEALPLALSAYDFNTDIDVNILGHIFENSLNDIEELKARIEDSDFDTKTSKRKKDGVFYTPEYITRYIVDNTLGTLCRTKKVELGLDNVEISIPNNPKKLNKTETAQKDALEAYRTYLLGLKILDPACGSGAFLNQALNYLLNEHAFIDEGIRTLMGGAVLGLYDVKKGILENNLYGVDINAEAVEIAKLSLWLRTVESGRKLNKLADKIKVGNSLIDDKSVVENAFVWKEEFPEVFAHGGFDVVIGNPPYGAKLDEKQTQFISKNFDNSLSGELETYIAFYYKISDLLKENGIFGYITPDTWLTIKKAKKLRENLHKNYTLYEIHDRYKPFADAKDTRCHTLIASKDSKKNYTFSIKVVNHKLVILKNFELESSILDDVLEWNLYISPIEKTIFNKMNESSILENLVKVKYGLRTGNNSKYLSNSDINNTGIKIARGSNIERYFFNWTPEYLIEKDGLPNSYFEETELSEKIIIQYVRTNSTDLKSRWLEACLIEEKNFVPLNSTSYLYQKDKDISLKYVLAVLSSYLLNYYYKQHYTDVNVKPLYLSKLPIKKITKEQQIPFIEKVDLLLNLNIELKSKKQKFLNRVQSNFDIKKLTGKLETFWQYDFMTLVAELAKQKVKLTLNEQDEWEEYFESYKKELLDLQAQIDATDKEIDNMVYKLYGLTEDEINIVENN